MTNADNIVVIGGVRYRAEDASRLGLAHTTTVVEPVPIARVTHVVPVAEPDGPADDNPEGDAVVTGVVTAAGTPDAEPDPTDPDGSVEVVEPVAPVDPAETVETKEGTDAGNTSGPRPAAGRRGNRRGAAAGAPASE